MTHPIPQTLETLARLGARLEVDATQVFPQTAEQLVRISGGNIVFFNAGHYFPQTLESLARLGGGKVTFRFGP